jgi:hypothetical protein
LAPTSKSGSLQIATAATERHPDNAVAWALLSLLYRAEPSAGADDATAARNAAHRAQELADAQRGGAPHSIASQPFLRLEVLLLELQLGARAQAAHAAAAAAPGAEAVHGALVMCKAQAASRTGDAATAVSILTAAAKRERARRAAAQLVLELLQQLTTCVH